MQALLEPGTLLADKYRIERVLGGGAMGVVLLAHHLQLDERVAIKVPLPEALGNPEAVARFMREARATVKIKSEYVARVSDVGTLPTGEPYIVMEYLDGQDLAALLKQHGPLPIEQGVEFVLQACEALAEAHSLGIVHRDLKPANLFCVRRADGILSAKVLDFGISKAQHSGPGFDASMTQAGAVMGSPLYMSPEQLISARELDARSDLWSIGVILFELISGKPPFFADSLTALSLVIAQSAPAPLKAYRPDVPAALEQVILRCLEKDRARRFANVAELAQALSEFAPKRALASVERIARVIQTAGLSQSGSLAAQGSESNTSSSTENHAAVATASAFGQTAPLAKPKKWPLVVAPGAIVLCGALAFAWSRRTPSEPAAPVRSAATQAPSQAALVRPVNPEPPAPAIAPPGRPEPLDSALAAPTNPEPPAAVIAPLASTQAPASSAPVGAPPTLKARDSRKVAPAPAAKLKAGCDPNFYFDALGEKHFKPECFDAPVRH